MISELIHMDKQEDNYKMHNTFEILKRKTIKNLWQFDPHTFNQNIQVFKRSKNIIFDGVFQPEST